MRREPTPIWWSARTRSSAVSIPRRRSCSAASPATRRTREINLYYREALLALAARSADGFFDFFDYHDFNTFTKYQQSTQGRTVEFFRTLLADTGFAGKPILVKAGGTHSGMDLASINRRLRQLQSEREQAEYLVKRFVHHAAHGVKLTLWGTIREDEAGEEDIFEDIFRQNGLVYNGLTRTATCDPVVESPCPDPGDGVIKLSFFSLKHLLEKASPLDWSNIETLRDGTQNVYAYRLRRVGAVQSAIFAWWDYFKDKNGATSKTVRFDSVRFSGRRRHRAHPRSGQRGRGDRLLDGLPDVRAARDRRLSEDHARQEPGSRRGVSPHRSGGPLRRSREAALPNARASARRVDRVPLAERERRHHHDPLREPGVGRAGPGKQTQRRQWRAATSPRH